MILNDGGSITIFDCIEFSDALRWIDVVNDLAFLTMDLHIHSAGRFAQCLLNAWLEFSGDFTGDGTVDLLPGISGHGGDQCHSSRSSGDSRRPPRQCRQQCRHDLRLALALTQKPTPLLLITHGVSGSGVPRRTGQLLEVLPGAIRIRADVERKRLFGLGPLDDSRSVLWSGVVHRRG